MVWHHPEISYSYSQCLNILTQIANEFSIKPQLLSCLQNPPQSYLIGLLSHPLYCSQIHLLISTSLFVNQPILLLSNCPSTLIFTGWLLLPVWIPLQMALSVRCLLWWPYLNCQNFLLYFTEWHLKFFENFYVCLLYSPSPLECLQIIDMKDLLCLVPLLCSQDLKQFLSQVLMYWLNEWTRTF